MNLVEFEALPGTVERRVNAERLFAVARQYRDMATRAYAGLSGADRADAPLHDYTADALGCIAQGKEVEPVIALLDGKWRAYATEQQARVAAAPKTTRGPMSGHSVIAHRWVALDAFEARARHIRQMVAL